MGKVKKAKYKYDLHCHTTRSDGRDSPKELIDNAAAAGMKAVAITDHDITPPEKIEVDSEELEIKEYAESKDLILIKGYEFSTDTWVGDVHILGYELNWTDAAVEAEVKRARKSKTNAYKLLCKKLTEKGMLIDFKEDILKYKNEAGETKYRLEDEVEKKFIFEKMAEKNYVSDWEEAKILIKNEPELNIKREKIHPSEAVKLIHDSGGTAVLAHPYLIDRQVETEKYGIMSREEYIEKLIDYGLDGIEARYTYDKTSYNGNKTVEEIEAEVLDLYADRLLISGGSDYHGGQKAGIENYRYLGEAGISEEQFKKLLSFIR
ncbi:MAG: PHP domain-containing protein [Halanaerobium sp.]